MPDPKIKRVIKRNMKDPLAPSEFDSFKKEQKKTFSTLTGVKNKSRSRLAMEKKIKAASTKKKKKK